MCFYVELCFINFKAFMDFFVVVFCHWGTSGGYISESIYYENIIFGTFLNSYWFTLAHVQILIIIIINEIIMVLSFIYICMFSVPPKKSCWPIFYVICIQYTKNNVNKNGNITAEHWVYVLYWNRLFIFPFSFFFFCCIIRAFCRPGHDIHIHNL